MLPVNRSGAGVSSLHEIEGHSSSLRIQSDCQKTGPIGTPYASAQAVRRQAQLAEGEARERAGGHERLLAGREAPAQDLGREREGVPGSQEVGHGMGLISSTGPGKKQENALNPA